MAHGARGEQRPVDVAIAAMTAAPRDAKKPPGTARSGRTDKRTSERREETVKTAVADDQANQELKRIIRTVPAERFPEADIHNVLLEPDEDEYGDNILIVTVVVSSPMRKLDVGSMLSFGRHLRPRLEEIGVNEFPLVRYLSLKDAKKLKLEPA